MEERVHSIKWGQGTLHGGNKERRWGASTVMNGQGYKEPLFEASGQGLGHHYGAGTRDSQWKGQDRGYETLQ